MLSSPTPRQILTESIVFWSIGLVLFLGRLCSRAISKKSWKKLQPDDYVMIVTFCCYTTLLVLLHFTSRYGTNQMTDSELAAVLSDPKEVADRIYGSKIVIGSNQCYLLTLWGVKACLLTLYYQMTWLTPANLYVKLLIVYTVIGLLAIEIPYFFILCRPFTQYWAVPVTNPQCANYFYYCIIQTVFNVSSDALMLLIPIPLMIKARAPPLKKALLLAVFSLGIFVIMAAIIHKYYNFSMPDTTVYMLWDIRETSTSIYVANIMCWWPLLRKIFGWGSLVRGASRSKSSEGHHSSGAPEEQSGVSAKLKNLTSSFRDRGKVDNGSVDSHGAALVGPESQETADKVHRMDAYAESNDVDVIYGMSLSDSEDDETQERRRPAGKAIVVTTQIDQVKGYQ